MGKKTISSRITLFLFVVILAIVLCSCQPVAGNQLHFFRWQEEVSVECNLMEFLLYNGNTLSLNTATKQFCILDNGGQYISEDYIVYGGTAPRYRLDIKEGYENIENHILELDLKDSSSSVIYTQAYLVGDFVYGICNVYDSTIGYLSGGGNYGEEEINHSVYYQYDNTSDTFEVIKKLDNALMVAFSGDTLIYWQNRNMYSYNITDGASQYLCKDYSYDSGLRHQSIGTIYFNDEYALFVFDRAMTYTYKNYVFLYDFSDKTLTEFSASEGDSTN